MVERNYSAGRLDSLDEWNYEASPFWDPSAARPLTRHSSPSTPSLFIPSRHVSLRAPASTWAAHMELW